MILEAVHFSYKPLRVKSILELATRRKEPSSLTKAAQIVLFHGVMVHMLLRWCN